jgi:uncharacterized membrane protein
MLKKYFIAGLLIWLPILATIYVLKFILNVLDVFVTVLPASYQPAILFGMDIPGLGILISLMLIFATGALATNIFGNKLVELSERLIHKIPMVRTIYSGTKKILETLVSSKTESFRKVVLVEYPRKGLWSIAFQVSSAHTQVSQHLNKEMVTVFIPTTPNPTSGFLIIMPVDEVIELAIPVEDAFKFVISLGTITGNEREHGKN